MKIRPKQINIQVNDELLEDIRVVANRRGQSLSEFVRRAIKKELELESLTYVVFKE